MQRRHDGSLMQIDSDSNPNLPANAGSQPSRDDLQRALEAVQALAVLIPQRFQQAHKGHIERFEIGSHLGLTLETVSRLFSRFQHDGLIVVKQKHVRINDLRALKSILKREVF